MREKVVLGVMILVAACKMQDESAAPAPKPHAVRFAPAPAEGDVASAVQRELSRARAENRKFLVYVGATWCEPCQKFHHAAEQGDLDTSFPPTTLLEFDADRDGTRLGEAGYHYRLIPLFVLPGEDGRSSGKQVEGAIKGDGAVEHIAPRLRDLVAQAK